MGGVRFGDSALGCFVIASVHSLLDVMIKLERDAKLITYAKQCLREAANDVHGERGFSTVRINVDVDPN